MADLCEVCAARMKKAGAEGKVGITLCGDCQARRAAEDAAADRCQYCRIGHYPGQPIVHESGCPANPDEEQTEPPELVAAIHAAVVAEACRWRGIEKPLACGEFTRISDVWRYARVALKVVREYDAARKAGG